MGAYMYCTNCDRPLSCKEGFEGCPDCDIKQVDFQTYALYRIDELQCEVDYLKGGVHESSED